MNSDPFFSILIPTYQAGHYLGNAIRSVLDQDYVDYEMIVVDDGSADDTEKLVESICDARLRYFSIAHGGTQNARYLGAKRARGKYLVFLDADDELTPYALRNIYARLLQYPCDLYIGGMYLDDGNGDPALLNDEFPEGYCTRNDLFKKMTDERLIKTLARKVVRREAAQYQDPFIREHTMSYGEDMFYSMDMLLSVQTVYFSREMMYIYHLHEDSTMHRFYCDKYRDRILMSHAIQHYGDLLGICREDTERIARVYLTKSLADCLLELDQAPLSDISEKEKVRIRSEIVNVLSKNVPAIRRYSDKYLPVQAEILRRYRIC